MRPRVKQVGVVLAGNAVAFFAASTADATVSVTRREGAESCPDERAFARRMSSDAGERTGIDTRDVHVEFERTSTGYRSTVRLASGAQRSLSDDASSCDGIADATALAIKLALDLEAGTGAANAPTHVAANAPASSPSVASEAPPIAPDDSVLRVPHAEMTVSGVVVAGLATPIATGVRAGATLLFHRTRWSLGLTGLALPAQSVDVGEGTVDISVFGGGLEGCGRTPVYRTLSAALCARVEALRMHGRARGYPRSDEDARPLFTTAIAARGHGRIAGPFSIFLEVAAIAPIFRERFAIDTVGPVYDPPIVGGSAGIGAAIDFE